jgi:parallel beta-helix repeat protein
MIVYTVGPNQQYESIQQAITTLVTQLGNNPATFTQDHVFEVYEGDYGGFIIPPNSIPASIANRLIIRAKPGHRVRLSGQITSPALGHGHPLVGIGIGDSNPFIHIDGIQIEHFHKGIVLGAACHNCTIKSNFITRCTNVGIWVYRSERVSVLNNVVLDFDHGVVATEIGDILIAHNDIINQSDLPASASPGDQFNVHLTARLPSNLGEFGAIVMYNNNIAAVGGTLIGYGPHILTKLRSNYNNLYNPGGQYAKAMQAGSSAPIIPDLSTWQTISAGDFGSISVPIPYYVSTQLGNAIFTQLFLQNYTTFQGISKGLPDLCNSVVAASTGALISPGALPAYTDTAEFCETVQSHFASLGVPAGTTAFNRPNPPSIGAYDTAYDVAGFAASVVAPVGVPGSGVDDAQCQGGIFSGNTVVEERYSQSVQCIVPSVVPGFFYAHDMQYYLYSDKASSYLGDCTVTDFILGAELHDKSSDGTKGIRVLLRDEPIPTASFDISSNRLRVRHKDLNLTDPDEVLTVLGTAYKWNDGTLGSFTRETFRQDFRVRDGITRYFIDSRPTRGAPIVLTDDMVSYSDDADVLGREFTTVWDSEEEKVEIKLMGSTNLLQNPQFDYIYDGQPANWEVFGLIGAEVKNKFVTSKDIVTEVVSSGRLDTGDTQGGDYGVYKHFTGTTQNTTWTGAYSLYPKVGENMLILSGQFPDTANGVRQRVRIDSTKPYWLTTYAAAMKSPKAAGALGTDIVQSATVRFAWSWYDGEHRLLKSHTGDQFDGVNNVAFSSDYGNKTGVWHRFGLAFANTKDFTLNKSAATGLSLVNTMTGNPIPIPDRARYVDIAVGTQTGAALDGLQFIQSYDVESYSREPRGKEITVEWDRGVTDLYNVTDLSITPIRNSNTSGFLYIGPIPAAQFDRHAPMDTTTLSDWGWATGRLEHLPWAKTSGKNKLRKRGGFNLEIQGQDEDITLSPVIGYPDDIQIVPRIPIANLFDGAGPSEQIAMTGVDPGPGVRGSDFTVIVRDDNDNPYGFEHVTVSLVDDLHDIPGRSYIGLIGVRDLGFYTQYNTSVSTTLDAAGAGTFRWIPPAADNAQVEVSDPLTQISVDNFGGSSEYFIDDLPYRINEAGMGNAFLSTPATPDGYVVTGSAYVDELLGPQMQGAGDSKDLRVYRTSRTPHRETFSLWVNGTGTFLPTGMSYTGMVAEGYDVRLHQSDNPEVSEGQYFVDEQRRLVFVGFNKSTNDDSHSIRAKYKERSTYLLGDDDGIIDDRRLHLSSELYQSMLTDVTAGNPLSVVYDIVVDLIITAHSPSGMTVESLQVLDGLTSTGKTDINIRERVFNGSLVGRSIPKRIGL